MSGLLIALVLTGMVLTSPAVGGGGGDATLGNDRSTLDP